MSYPSAPHGYPPSAPLPARAATNPLDLTAWANALPQKHRIRIAAMELTRPWYSKDETAEWLAMSRTVTAAIEDDDTPVIGDDIIAGEVTGFNLGELHRVLVNTEMHLSEDTMVVVEVDGVRRPLVNLGALHQVLVLRGARR